MSFYFKRHLSWSLSPLGSVCNGCLLRLIPKYHPGGSHHLMPTWKSSASSICNLPLSWLIPSFPSSIYSTGFLEKVCISSVQFSRSVVSDSLRPHESQHARPPCPSPTPRVHSNSCASVGDAIQPCHPLSPLLLLPPIPPSIRVFSNESTFRMRWPKYWSFSLSISPSNEQPGGKYFEIIMPMHIFFFWQPWYLVKVAFLKLFPLLEIKQTLI